MSNRAASGRSARNFVEVVRRHAAERPGQRAFTFLRDGEAPGAELTYTALDRLARAVAAEIQCLTRPGDRVLLLFPPGLDFIAAFLGCLYAGVVAVPAHAPRLNRADPRLAAILGDARPAVVLTVAALRQRVEAALLAVGGPADLACRAVDSLPVERAGEWRPMAVTADSLAFLQYTSGSTATPKGVMVSQANLLHNMGVIRDACRHDASSRFVSWLPLFHDMGLIGNVLQPLFLGAEGVLLSPATFLQRPVVWLRAISRHRAHTSGGPNFAYELCLRRIGQEERAGLDLSSWQVAFNGAEPVRAATLRAFAAAFAPCGLRPEALYPCYGLAEATLFVTGGGKGRAPAFARVSVAALRRGHAVEEAGGATQELAGCGRPWLGQEVVIVAPEERTRRADGTVGEVWVCGGSVARGYWGRPESTASEFAARLRGEPQAGPFLRTGDLGFLRDGELFITGRRKDLIIVRGRNLYPQDLERTAESSHAAVRPGCAAAFTLAPSAGDAEDAEVAEEKVVVACELAPHAERQAAAVAEAVRRAVSEEHEVQVHDVVLVRAGSIPKTTSGKLQHHACRDLYREGTLSVVYSDRAAGIGDEEQGPAGLDLLPALAPDEARALLLDYLADELSRALRLPRGRLDVDRPVSSLGLDSLAAVELSHRIEARLGVGPSFADLLAGATARELAGRLGELRVAPAAAAMPRPVAQPAPASGEFPLARGQAALWFLDRLEPGNPAYILAGAARVRGRLDTAALAGALTLLAARHPALSTTFGARTGQPFQRVQDTLPLVREVEASSWSEARLGREMAAEAAAPFDLAAGPLLRLTVYRRSPDDCRLVLAVHHIVADFWSLGVLLDELGSLYAERAAAPPLASSPLPLPPLSLLYTDYVAWQQRLLAGAEGERLWRFWSAELGTAPPVVELPTDRPRPRTQTFGGAAVALRLPEPAAAALEGLARRSGATLFMALLAGFQTLLWRYSGQDDLVVGAPFAGRGAAELAGLVGYFVNPLALRGKLSPDLEVAGLLARTRERVLAAAMHQDYPFPLLAERLHPRRDPGRPPVFQVLFVMQQARRRGGEALAGFALGESGVRLELGGLVLESVALEQRSSQFELSLHMARQGAGLAVSLRYNTDLFEATTARRMTGHLSTLLTAFAESDRGRLGDLPLLAAGERAQLLTEWNDTEPALDSAGLGLHELFAAQAVARPAAEALVGDGERLTYGELARRARALAHRLRSHGVGPEVVVGVALPRRPELVVALLAVLEAGGTYLPLDPAYPPERLAFMLADSGARLLLLAAAGEPGAEHRGLEPARPPPARPPPEWAAGVRTLVVDPGSHVPPRHGPQGRERGARRVTLADQLSHIIYTSGSTGRPKGIGIRHGSATALVRWAATAFSPAELAGVLASTSVCFDLSVFEIFVPLCLGGRVILADNALALPELRHREEVTLLNTVPSAMAELVRLRNGLPDSLRTANLAGEPLKGSLVAEIYRRRPDLRLLDLYGPSEDTTYSTLSTVARGSTAEPSLGRPLAGGRAYLLDRALAPVPIGVAGEICLGGAGLARGYQARPALTAERFVPDAVSGRRGERLYRTGDLARFAPDGQIQFLGRIDHQVKVRGFRIEPGEIEAVLVAHEAVREAAVLVRENGRGERCLVAYLVPAVAPGAPPVEALPAAALRRHLATRLPDYMVPSAFICLAALPLTPNVKLDRRALPAPAWADEGEQKRPPGGPRDPMEDLVAAAWAEVLGRAEVGLDDDFFDLGGHSLLATQVVARLEQALSIELPVRSLFEAPTVAALARRVQATLARGARPAPPPLRPAARHGDLPLSFAQEGLWYLDQLQPGSSAYNLPVALRLRGPLQPAWLARAVAEVVRRHEALRTTFVNHGGRPLQRIAPELRVALPLIDLADLPAEARAATARRLAAEEARRPFDLERGPLLRLALLRLAAEEHVALLAMHHIVSDAWSLALFFAELGSLYSAFAAGRPPSLAELPVQPADFAIWQREWLAGPVLAEQLAWWRRQLAGAAVLELLSDRPSSPVRHPRGGRRPAPLAGELVAALSALGRREGATLFMTLLAGFTALLAHYTRQEDITVGSPIASRQRGEIAGLIGFFVNTLVLRSDVSGNPTGRELLGRVREVALGAYAHQELPFEKLVEELQPERGASRSPLFQVLLVLQNAPPAALVLPDLALSLEPIAGRAPKYDLTLSLLPGEPWSGELEYNRELYDGTTIERLLGHFAALLTALASSPESRLWTMPLLGEAERHQLLIEWTTPAPALPAGAGARYHVLGPELEPSPIGVPGELCSSGGLPPGDGEDPVLAARRSVPDPLGREPGSRLYRSGERARYRADGTLELLGRGVARSAARLSRQAAAEAAGRPPRNPIEELLAGLWARVLGRERVGCGEDFFALGGHSLLATRLVSQIGEAFAVELSLRALFAAPTVELLAAEIDALLRQGANTQAPPLRPLGRGDLAGLPAGDPAGGAEPYRQLPLSFAQQRLWFLDQLQPGSPAYNIPFAARLRGRLATARLAASIDRIAARHETLRTRFVVRDGQPVQVIARSPALALPLVDLGALPPAAAGDACRRLLDAEARQPFDLAKGPLLRATLLRRGALDHVLLLTVHHIVADGWSIGVFLGELAALYRAGAAGEPAVLASLPVQYGDFAVWQRAWLSGEVLAAELEHWRRRLAGAPALLPLATDRARPAAQGLRGASQPCALPASLALRLLALAQSAGCTPFMVLLAGFQAVLARHSGVTDVVVGAPIANRNRLETEGLIGFFVNPLVLRTSLDGAPSFRQLLRRVRGTALDAYAHQDLPFELLVEALRLPRDLGFSPVFQVLLVLQNAALPDLDLPGIDAESLVVDNGSAKFDLTLSLAPRDGGVAGWIEYDRDLFDGATVRRLAGHLATLLEAAAAAPGRPLPELPLLSPAESAQLLVEWNDTLPAAAPEPSGLHHLCAARAAHSPHALALVCGAAALTYRELEARANRLARHLRALGVGRETRVAVCLERSPELVVALLATLKAGGAWVPLDPAYPAERLGFILVDSAAAVLLTDERLRCRFPAAVPATVVTLDGCRDAVERQGDALLDLPCDPRQLAYLIYTSGSTGRPKGVAIEHRSAVAFLRWALAAFRAEELAAVLASTSVCFDLAVFELFAPLAAGGRIVLVRDVLDLASGAAAGVTLINTVPSAAAELLRLAALPASVRTINLAGEPLRGELAERLYAGGRVERVWNLYGPSEATTYSTGAVVPREQGREPAIGRPISGTTAYVADPGLRLAPAGVPGELCLGGRGLARGYFRRPDLTAERFVPDPFGREPGGRLYRTGDLVRHRPEGSLEFLGRFDHQVKVRGFRIELDEVAVVVAAHPAVAEAAVATRPDAAGDPRLIAWWVARPGSAPADAANLRAFLAARLPHYMLPQRFCELPALPRTPNGKLDRRALPELAEQAAGRGALAAPRTPTEELLCDLWAELLGVPRVGIHDEFFALGGHSLLAVRLVGRVRAACGVELPLRSVFTASTVETLAPQVEALLRGGRSEPPAPLRPLPRQGPELASFAQERLWLLDQLEPGSAAYNVPLAVRLRGRLVAAALARALAEVARRHQALRTTLGVQGGRPVQVIAPPPGGAALPCLNLTAVPAPRREALAAALLAAESRRPFDLARGPLLRALLLQLDETEHLFFLNLHHAVTDGWSLGVLTRELEAAYRAALSGLPSPLPELAVQYADYSAWQRQRLTGARLAADLAWWRERLAGVPATLDLPADRARPALPTSAGAVARSTLPSGLAGGLQRLCRDLAATPFMTLLAAFAALLWHATGEEDLLLGSPVANRGQVETEELIGLFVNTVVLRVDLAGDPAFRRLAAGVRETALAAFARQDLPFEKLVEELEPERSLGHTPLFQVLFVLQNAPLPPLSLPGLGASPVEVTNGCAKFDLTLTLVPEREGVAAWLEYRRDLFDAATMGRLLAAYQELLAGAVEHPETRLSQLALLGAAARHQLVHEWSGAAAPAPAAADGDTVHGLFEAQAARTPAAPALRWPEGVWSYRELDARADRLAGRLRDLGVGPEVRVAVCCGRQPEMVAALLAVLKAGGGYVPLDAAYPPERLALMLADSAAAVVVCSRRAAGLLPATAARLLVLDPAAVGPAAGPGTGPPAAAGSGPAAHGGIRPACGAAAGATAGNLAYLIYTSGSTGRPKGVAIEHRSAVALLRWARAVFGPEELAGVLAATSICFDLSVFELFAPLGCGGCVVLADNALTLPEHPARGAVTLVNTVPSALAQLVRAGALPSSVRTVNLAGEPLGAALARQVHALGTVERLYNLYGPTEDTTYSTWERVGADGAEPAIGRPVAGSVAYVASGPGRLAASGVAGELLLGGAGLARGYLDRQRLTAERFVPDPWSGRPGARLYRTGDRVRHLADGRLEFLGRIDQQVKVRGFRIEPGEVEAALGRHPDVADCLVMAREDTPGDRCLAAYVVMRPGAAADLAALRAQLRRQLPEFMVPAAFVLLGALPLSPNGKVDRRALPAPASPERAQGSAYVAPRTPLEARLAAIWSRLLGVEPVGVRDDFFALGGHSLLAAQSLFELREECGLAVPLRSLFLAPTIAGLAELAPGTGSAAGAAGTVAGPVPVVHHIAGSALAPAASRRLPASSAQERLWLLDRLLPGSDAYHLAGALRLRGELAAGCLRLALDLLIARHEALRTAFVLDGGALVQVVHAACPLGLPSIDLTAVGEARRQDEIERLSAAAAARPFDLARAPLVRAMLIRASGSEHVLVLVLHHIACDGWSTGVLARDLGELYAGLAAGRRAELPELPIQYADYAVWQRAQATAAERGEQLAYWRARLADAPLASQLAPDRPGRAAGEGPARRSGRLVATLPPRLAADLATLARSRRATLFMTLLAAFLVLLERHGGGDDLVVGTPVVGRDRGSVLDLIGVFLNTLALRVSLAGDPTFGDLLERVRDTALGAYARQDLPFEEVLAELRPRRLRGRSPFFQTVFNMLSYPRARLVLPGIAVELLPLPPGAPKFELEIYAEEEGGGIALCLVYDAGRFDGGRMAERLRQYAGLLAQAAADPERRIGGLSLVTAEARALLPDPRRPLGSAWAGAVHAGFAAAARHAPEQPAVTGDAASWTYGEIEERSNHLARCLLAQGIARGQVVAVYAARSAELVWALLGVLKAGAAFLILDPAYPASRLVEYLRLARPRGWLRLVAAGEPPAALSACVDALPLACRLALSPAAGGVLAERAGAAPPPVSGELLTAPPSARGPGAPRVALGPDDLAYVAFTSGSTGAPKGVLGRHGPLAQMFPWYRETFGLGPRDRFSMLSGLAHDPLHRDVFLPLQLGASIAVPAAGQMRRPGWLARWMAAQAVTVVNLTPAIGQLLTEGAADGALPRLRLALFVGDVLRRRDVERLRRVAPRVQVVNLYGTTETQQANAWLLVAAKPPPDATAEDVLPLGRGLPGVQLLVRNAAGQQAGVAEVGEIGIRSPHLARGYLDDPELTARRFVRNAPGSGAAEDRVYLTGDLGCYLPSGEVEYRGRADQQLQVRGFRVEPREVEQALAAHPRLRHVVVVPCQDPAGERRLVAYVVPRPGPTPDFTALRRFLLWRLPDYMVPVAAVALDALPLLPNGKVDLQALPAPHWPGDGSRGGQGAAPRDPVEEAMAGLWAEVLGVPRVGIHDSFFELGGHSLLAVRLLLRVREVFAVELAPGSVFDGPTVAELAAAVRRGPPGPPEPGGGAERLPLPAAEREEIRI
jgi:amino acid adenylation domain-containing protein